MIAEDSLLFLIEQIISPTHSALCARSYLHLVYELNNLHNCVAIGTLLSATSTNKETEAERLNKLPVTHSHRERMTLNPDLGGTNITL